MSKNLFIGSLSYDATDSQLEAHFAKVGKVVSAKVIIDRNTGKGKGFGFVEMETEEEAKKAIKELNSTNVDNRPIIVKEATPRE